MGTAWRNPTPRGLPTLSALTSTQIKAAVAVNSALIEFYWNLGKDIAEKFAEEARYGSRFFEKVSFDMRAEIPNDSGFSPRSIRYCQDFYCLYSAMQILPQVVVKSAKSKQPASKMPQVAAKCYHSRVVDDKLVQQLVAQLVLVPWGHHRTIIDKCKCDRNKALSMCGGRSRTVEPQFALELAFNRPLRVRGKGADEL